MNLLCRFVGLAVFASASFLPFEHGLAQLPDVTATVQFSNGQSVSISDFSDLIGIQPNELVNITIQFSPGGPDQTAKIEALDGGAISFGNNVVVVVNTDGTLPFQFQATAHPGERRIAVKGESQTVILKLWVLDSTNPQNNPPVITPPNHGS